MATDSLLTGLRNNPMALYTTEPTYDVLIEVLKIYLNRYDEDTINAMPMFINLAEKSILRQIRMPSIEKMVKFNLLDDGFEAEGFLPMPSDYIEMKFVWVEGREGQTLGRVTFDQFLAMKYSNYTGPNTYQNVYNTNDCGCGDKWATDSNETFDSGNYTPRVWAINGDRLYLHPISPRQEVYMTYYADIEELSEDNQTNCFLDLLPDAVLYYSVAEGFRFLMETDKAEYWEQQAFKRLTQVKNQVEVAEYSGSPLTVSPA